MERGQPQTTRRSIPTALRDYGRVTAADAFVDGRADPWLAVDQAGRQVLRCGFNATCLGL
jgi:hypothetical protein